MSSDGNGNNHNTLSLQTILDATPYCLMLVGEDKIIRYANSATLELFGYESEAEMVGQVCHEFVCPAEEGKCPVLDLGQKVDKSERKALARDGSFVPIMKTVVPVTMEGQKMLLEAFIDLTQWKIAEEFIKGILESVDEAFIVIDRDYRITSANRAFLEQTGQPRDAVIGSQCYRISHRSDIPCYDAGEHCAVRQTFETGHPQVALHTHIDPHGKPLYVETKSYPLRDSMGRITSAIEIINDVTERKKLEEQLRQSQKMEAIGTLTGGIAHDFNNILTTIIGYSEFLMDELPADSRARQYAEQIVASGTKAAQLTQSLLAFSRKQVITPEPVRVNAVILNMKTMLCRMIREDIEIRTDLSAEDPLVMADRLQMEQIIMNLSTNARDALSGGGSIIISTALAEIDPEFIKTHGFGKPGRYALVSISDNGTGMDKPTCLQIFEPFFTTKEVGKGTGLGLSVVYGIVKQHGGFINVYSEPGLGTTFKVYLPLAPSGLSGSEAEAEPAREHVATVLMAEDDEAVRSMIKITLTGAGYRVIEAANGEEALIKFIENVKEVDLLLLDVIMPKKSGIDVFIEARRINPDAKIILLSGYPADLLYNKGLPHGEIDLLLKPVSPTELVAKIKKTIA
jgi:PAS domain S-box-containing protein